MATGTGTRGLSTAAPHTDVLCAEDTETVSTRLHRKSTAFARHSMRRFVLWKIYRYISNIFYSYLSPAEEHRLHRARYHDIARAQLMYFVSLPHFPPPAQYVSSVWARRGHDANILTCDWLRRSCGWVDVNARYKRACKEPVFNLAVFSVQCPPDRVEPRVC